MAEDVDNHTLRVLRQMRREQADTAGALARLIRGTEERLTHQMTGMEQRLTGVEQRLTGVEQRLTGTEQRLTGIEERLTRQMATLCDDLETTIKMEIGGSIAHLETRLEDRMDDRLDAFRRDLEPS